MKKHHLQSKDNRQKALASIRARMLVNSIKKLKVISREWNIIPTIDYRGRKIVAIVAPRTEITKLTKMLEIKEKPEIYKTGDNKWWARLILPVRI